MIDIARLARLAWLFLFMLLVVACSEGTSRPGAVGFTASDRVELVADRSEPIVEIRVSEGAEVEAGEVLVVLDGERLTVRLAQAQAQLEQARARYAELAEGPRLEVINEQRARLKGTRTEVEFRRTEFERVSALLERKLSSPDLVDRARAALSAALSAEEAAAAKLAELDAGTRTQRLRQAQEEMTAIKAAVESVRIDLERLSVRAPVRGVIDSLPFEPGEQPAAGQVVAVLLAGAQAHARVYVPEQIRVEIAPGIAARVQVDGLERVLTGRVRRIESASTFTPYFALTVRDRGRLSYVAEIQIEGFDRRLPDGIPVEVSFPGITDRIGGR